LRIGLSSRALGKAGTVQMPVEVPKPSDDQLQIGGIALAVAGVSAPAMNAAAMASLVPFQPTPGRAFASTDTLRIFGRLFWRSKDTPVVTIAIKTVPASLKNVAVRLSPDAKGHQEGAFDTTMALAGLTPGRYVLAITGKLGTAKPVTREVPLVVR
jgi:hypothetical protein